MQSCPSCQARVAPGQRFCSQCGSALAPADAAVGERRFATFLFADVAQSTAIAERLDPEDWTAIMNGAFAFMNAAVSRYGGTVSRLMGDAVLALFGAPQAHEDDAERAVRAGLEIQQSARVYAQTVRRRWGVEFALRVGINTGTAVLAVVGDAIRNEYTAMGDAANVAARLQSSAEPGTVLISADTQRLVAGLFDFNARGAIEVKGKQTPVDSFEVVGVRAAPGRTRGLEGVSSALVGRERELALLRERLVALERGRGAVVVIVGEAGLGKSRLVAELRRLRDAAPEPGIAWYEARAISYGQSIPYFPWRQLARQMIGAGEMDDPTTMRDKLAAFVERLGLGGAGLPFYETLLAIDDEASRSELAGVPGDTVVEGVAGVVMNALRALMHEDHEGERLRPNVLVLDDLHWSDSATLELIAQVAALTVGEPLLLLCQLRPDRKAPSWGLVDRLQASLGSVFERIDLEPLSSAEADTLLANLLPVRDLPDAVRRQILERSEGNPFYLEEVLRTLIDCGQVVRDDGHWRATRTIVDAQIPQTLAGVLSARIDRLPEATKRVAQTAAVIGRVFTLSVLEHVCHASPPPERVEHIEPHIATLSYEQVVRERMREPEREYIFKHALTCEAAYGLLLRARRRELHARCGAALEVVFAQRRDEFAPMLAYHYGEAEELPRAIDYARRAALNARKLYALREELGHRERILGWLERMADAMPGERIDAVLEWTLVRHKLNEYDGVLERLTQAVAMARASGDKHRLAHALSWAGNIHVVTGFPSRAFPYIEESRRLAAEVGDEQLLLLPLFVATLSLVDRDPAASVQALHDVIDQARAQGVNEVMAHAMAYRAVALARIGEFDAARTQIAEALAAAPHAGSPVKEADVHIAVGMAYYDMGEVDKGLEHERIGAQKAYEAHGLECACAGAFGVGRGHHQQGELDAALSQYGRSLEIAERVGVAEFGPFMNMIDGSVALAEFERGSPAAIERLRRARENAHGAHDEFGAAALSQQLAGALMTLGRHAEAEPLLDEAMRYYRPRGMRPYLIGALKQAGQLSEAAGRSEEARRWREEAADLQAGLHAPRAA